MYGSTKQKCKKESTGGRIMEGRIDTRGILRIKRNNVFKEAICAKECDVICGDDCALFGEPRTISDGSVHLSLCCKVLVFGSFEDERK